MRRRVSYGVIIFFILIFIGLLIIDYIYSADELGKPIWNTTWFRWRVVMLGVIITGIIAYFWISKLLEIKNRQIDFSRKLMAARESERRVLAAELDDDLQKELNSIKLGIDRIRTASTNGNREQLKELSEHITGSIEKIRDISRSLYPAQLESLGLKSAIEKLFTDAAAQTGMNPEINIADIDDLFSLESRIQIYRIIQEAVNNIVKHSKATKISADITKDDRFLRIVVTDNGKGIPEYDPKFRPGTGSFGLTSMFQRVKVMNGSMDIKTSKMTGTKLLIYIPILNKINT